MFGSSFQLLYERLFKLNLITGNSIQKSSTTRAPLKTLNEEKRSGGEMLRECENRLGLREKKRTARVRE